MKTRLFKLTTKGKTQFWEIEVDGNKFRTSTGQVGSSKTITTEWTICKGKNIGRSNETTPAEQALAEAEAKITKKMDGGYGKSATNAKRATFFEPMLAEKYEDNIENLKLIKWEVASQPKLDGMRCIVTINGMFSRNGKPIVAAPHIMNALIPFFKKCPYAVFDGELYNHKFKNDFNEIISHAKKTKPTKEDLIESEKHIEYHIYDVFLDRKGNDDIEFGNEQEYGFYLRYCTIEDIFSDKIMGDLLPSCIKIVETHICTSKSEVDKKYEEYLEQGYEGQILRIDGHRYQNKRTKYLLKRKEFIDEEYVIVDIVEGEGNRTGTAGYMVFTARNGSQFKSNIKGNFEYVTQLLKDRKKLIGKKATVKYFNLTPAGIPRFPYVIAVRDYE